MSDEHNKAIAIIEQRERAAMSPVVATGLEILRANPNPETLRELLAMQREHEANEARKAYTAALVALKRDLPTVIKHDKTVSFDSRGGKTSYTHATLAHVMEEITPALTQHGFSLTFHPLTRDGRVFMTCRLTHAAGHYNETTIDAPYDNSGGKNAVQAVGSAITYLQRYTALALLGIATADMPDADAAEAPRQVDAGKVDSQRNLAAVEKLRKRGKTVEQAVAFIGRPVAEWTAVDLARLGEWSRPAPAAKSPKVEHTPDCGANGGEPCDRGCSGD